MHIWVDTDFGFDDLWALLLLKYFECDIDGISVVAGNTPLQQVVRNATAADSLFNFNCPLHIGAEKPLQREPETAERVLGTYGMQTRGLLLPYSDYSSTCAAKTDTSNDKGTADAARNTAVAGMVNWLSEFDSTQIIALGPLTNLAQLIQQYPDIAHTVDQITWLGGSRGRGNHTRYAEFNALADPDALAVVSQSHIPLKIIDLELCRQVSFGESDLPAMQGANRQLLADLLGGYLDIALKRGRSGMSIYDPLAVLSVFKCDLFKYTQASLNVHTKRDAMYGRTDFDVTANVSTGSIEVAADIDAAQARRMCLEALTCA